jgi:hypothetical protein
MAKIIGTIHKHEPNPELAKPGDVWECKCGQLFYVTINSNFARVESGIIIETPNAFITI